MFWDRVAGVYDVFVDVINRRTHQRLKKIVSDLIGPDDTVMECACGTGLLSAAIAPKCRLLTATDFSRKMLKKAEKNCAAFHNIRFAQADITALPYPDSSFDKVVAGNVIPPAGQSAHGPRRTEPCLKRRREADHPDLHEQ